MLTRRIRTQLIAFVVIALLGVSYIAVKYVGVLRVIGVTGYTVKMDLPTAGGLFNNAEVTYRGVPVGRVGGMQLTSTGIQVTLDIASTSTKIPSDLAASVADLSVIGEQYVDLVPASDTGPYLHQGSVIAQADTSIPISATQLLTSSVSLLNSVPVGALQTTIDQLGAAFQDSAPELQTLLNSANSFYAEAREDFPATASLIQEGATVLATQESSSASIATFASNLKLVAANLDSSDADLRALLGVTPGAATQVDDLFSDLGTPLGLLLANLTTTGAVFQANVGGLQTILAQAPDAVNLGNTVITSSGAKVGLALTFFNPLPCTAGYGATVRHLPSSTVNTPLNTSAGCISTSGGTDVRGALDQPASSWTGPASAAGGSTVSSLAALLDATP